MTDEEKLGMTSTTSVLARTLVRAFETEIKNLPNPRDSRLWEGEVKGMVTDLLNYLDSGALPALPRRDYRASTATDRERLLYLYDRRNGLSKPQLEELRRFIERNGRLLPDDSDNMRRAIEIDLLPRTVSSRFVH